MKLERLSENKIRCTLNKADLQDKQLLLSELAYGTEKAKELFSEMMQRASQELGFEADNIPLMVEAIPVSRECLVLIITKVEDPEELDTRFSNFTKPPIEIDITDERDEDESFLPSPSDLFDNIKELMSLDAEEVGEEIISAFQEGMSSLPDSAKGGRTKGKQDKNNKEASAVQFKLYRFQTLDELSTVASLTETLYNGDNTLYKSPSNKQYYLLLNSIDNRQAFHSVCNILGEYGERMEPSYATPYYMREHYRLIIPNNALQTLASL